VQKDSTFARAYAGIANVYAMLPLYSNVRVDTLMPRALAAVNRAIVLDSTLPEAYTARAALLEANWRWAEAERDYRHALLLEPNDLTTHQWYGELLLLNGRIAEAQAQLKRATELDPLSPVAFGSYALSLAAGGAVDAAVTAARRAVELDSTLVATRFMLGGVYLEGGRYPEAVRELEATSALFPSSMHTLGLLGYAYAKAGRPDAAREILRGLEAAIGQTNGAAPAAARVYIGLGDGPRALSLLERAVADHDPFFSSESMSENFFDSIRGDRRFAALVAALGLDRRLLTMAH